MANFVTVHHLQSGVWTRVGRSAVAPPGPSAQVGAKTLGTTAYVVPSGALFVSPSGNDSSGAGTQASPWRSFAHAVAVAASGSTIVMRAGSYNESLSVPAGKIVTGQAYPGEAVWFDGSVAVTGWSAGSGVWTASFTAPTRKVTTSSTYIDPNYPNAGDPLVVTFDGALLAKTAGTPTAGQFAVDDTSHTLTIGQDPTGHAVTASNLKTCITGTGQVNLYGVGVRRYATDVIEGMNGPLYLTTAGGVLENCVITQNGFGGLALYKGGFTVRYCTVSDNGYVGITGDRLDGTQVVNCAVTGNNRQRMKSAPSNGAIKFTRADGLTVAGCTVTGNLLCNGIWTDVSVRAPRIYSNTVTAGGADGASQGVNGHDQYGIICELSGQGFIADNRVTGYQYSIVVRESDHMRIFNNESVSANSYAIALVRDSRDGNNSSTGATNEYLHGDYPGGVPWQAVNCVIANNKCSGSPAFFQVGGDDEYGSDGWQTGTDMQLTINGNWVVSGNVGWPNSTGGQTSASSSAALNSTAGGQTWTNSFGATVPDNLTAAQLPNDIADAVGVPRLTQKVGKLT